MIDVEALKAATDIVAVVGSYTALKKRGQEYVGRCVFHSPDEHPSFYVIPAKRFCTCFSCGFSGDVIEFLQEKEGIGFQEACARLGNGGEWVPRPITQEAKPLPDRVTSKPPADAGEPQMLIRALGQPSRTWAYRDAQGDVLGYVARYDTPEGKEVRCWTFGARPGTAPAWGCGHWSKPRPLYGLDRLAAKPAAWVLVVEGEKAADAAAELLPMYAAITWPGGARAWHAADWEPLRGRKALLWPDADEPGIECMQRLAGHLYAPRGLACHVRIVDVFA